MKFHWLLLVFVGFGSSGFSSPPECAKKLGATKRVGFAEWAATPLDFAPALLPGTPHLPVLIIGAGPGGLAAMAEFKRRGIPFVGVEAHSTVGGMWAQANPESPAYDNLITNSSRATTHLGTPMPAEWPDYLHHTQALAYLERFAILNGLLPHLRFSTRVRTLERGSSGSWWAVFADGVREEFRAVVVASGKNSKSNAAIPEKLRQAAEKSRIPFIHSAEFKNAEAYRGSDVLVVGFGNSGAEIATQVSAVAAHTYLSVRSGSWVVPLYLLGIPSDAIASEGPQMPHWIERPLFQAILAFLPGYPTRFGLPAPNHAVLDELPVSDRGILRAIREKRVLVRSGLADLRDGRAVFSDAASERVDSVIFATGYGRRFPFLPSEYADFGDPAFRMPFLVFPPETSGLFFMTVVTVPQSAWNLFTDQARAIGACLTAESRRTPNFHRFQRLRRVHPGPDLKGHLFGAADQYHVDPHLYAKRLRQLAEWLEH